MISRPRSVSVEKERVLDASECKSDREMVGAGLEAKSRPRSVRVEKECVFSKPMGKYEGGSSGSCIGRSIMLT